MTLHLPSFDIRHVLPRAICPTISTRMLMLLAASFIDITPLLSPIPLHDEYYARY
jgi:hypothetical protein